MAVAVDILLVQEQYFNRVVKIVSSDLPVAKITLNGIRLAMSLLIFFLSIPSENPPVNSTLRLRIHSVRQILSIENPTIPLHYSPHTIYVYLFLNHRPFFHPPDNQYISDTFNQCKILSLSAFTSITLILFQKLKPNDGNE